MPQGTEEASRSSILLGVWVYEQSVVVVERRFRSMWGLRKKFGSRRFTNEKVNEQCLGIAASYPVMCGGQVVSAASFFTVYGDVRQEKQPTKGHSSSS